MDLRGSLAEQRNRLIEQVATGDLEAQRRLRRNMASVKAWSDLKDKAAKGDPAAKRKVENRRRGQRDWKRSKISAERAKREAGDAEAIARYETALQRDREREAVRNGKSRAGERRPGSASSRVRNCIQSDPEAALNANTTLREQQPDSYEADDDFVHSTSSQLYGRFPTTTADDDEDANEHHTDEDAVGAPATQAVFETDAQHQRQDSAVADEVKVPQETENDSELEEVKVSVKAERIVIDLTKDDGSEDQDKEELALQLEIEQRAARAAELKLKMLKLRRRH